MSKWLKIGLIVIVILVLIIIIVLKILKPKSVGIDNTLTNEQGKTGTNNLDSSKVLVIYFSQSGNTQKLAKLISDKVGGDFIRIETIEDYPTEYSKLASFAKKEKDNNSRPELKNLELDLEKYDTIFIGYPIWWYQMPMPMYTFFDTFDFSGKVIIPFNTHEGSKDSGTYEDIKELEPNATVLEGLPIRGGDMASDQGDKVDNWLKKLGY